MRPNLLSIAIALSLSSIAHGQAFEAAPASGGGVNWAGSDARIGLGIDKEGDVTGDVFWIFSENGRQTLWADAWWGHAGEGGLRVGRHWVPMSRVGADGIANENAFVLKGFLAIDQNAEDDRKFTLGTGWEREDWFATLYASRATSGARPLGTRTFFSGRIITGDQNGRPFNQVLTTSTTTRSFERAFDAGIGVRAGRFVSGPDIRVWGGFDREIGDHDARLSTFSMGLDKQLSHGLSVGGEASWNERKGPIIDERSESRLMAHVRYHFGRTASPALRYNPDATAPPPTAVQTTAVSEPAVRTELIKNNVELASDAFFALDRSNLDESTRASLLDLVQRMRELRIISDIQITGHTCDLGTDAYNQGLSERRAAAVVDFLVENGIDRQSLRSIGKGESSPLYPNTPDSRHRNRRVDIEFVSEEVTERLVAVEQEVPATEWKREPVRQAPAWLARALRTPTEYKRRVDTYRFDEVSSDTVEGPREFINRAPIAADDQFSVPRDSTATVFDVLANDSDPDGDALVITATTAPANGTVNNLGQALAYEPAPGFVGTDTFQYTIADPDGLMSTATVTVTVTGLPLMLGNDQAQVFKNQSVDIDVLANDQPPDGTGPLQITAVGTPSNGSAELIGTIIRYTPNAGFVGTDSFTYTVLASDGTSATAVVQVQVINRAPVAVNDSASTAGTTPVLIDVLANDSDPDGDPLEIAGFDGVSANGGSITQLGQSLRYQAAVGFVGSDTFGYTIRDDSGATAQAIVTIQVQSAGAAPIAMDDTVDLLKATETDIDVLANDSAADGGPLQIVGFTQPQFGTVTLNADQTLRYSHQPGTTGLDSFTYTVADQSGLTAVGTVTVRIIPIPRP